MHYAGIIRRAQTTGSIVSHLALPNYENSRLLENEIVDIHWVTHTSSPCISVFKPIIGIDSFPDLNDSNFIQNESEYKSLSFWALGELLHRLTLSDFANRSPLLHARSKQIEKKALADVSRLADRVSIHDKNLSLLRKKLTLKYYTQHCKMMIELIQLFTKKNRALDKRWRFGSSLLLWYYWNWSSKNKTLGSFKISNFFPRRIIPIDFVVIGSLLVCGGVFMRRNKK